MKKKLLSLAQLAVGILLIAFLFANMKNKGDLLDAVRGAAAHWMALSGGVSLFLVCLLLCAWRWHILLHAQGLCLPFRRTLTLFFIGHFFNSFLFGVTGGDVVKAYYAARETHHKKAEAVSTVVLDRLIGLFALVALIVVVMLARWRFFMAQRETQVAFAFFCGLFAASVAGIVMVFRQDLFARIPLLARFQQRSAVGAVIQRMYSAFQIGLTHPPVLWRTLAISLTNHVMIVVCMLLLARALDVSLGFLDGLTLLPIINAVAAIPVTPGGLGTRETSAKFLLGVVGVPETRAVLLTLLTYGTVLAWSLVGGIFYLVHSARGGRALVDDSAATE